MAPKIGFIGIVGEMWKEDPQGTLKWLQGLGIDGMEGGAAVANAFGVSPAEGRQKLAQHGLTCPIQGRVSFGQSEDEMRQVLALAKEMGAAYVVDYFAPFNDRDEILRYCAYFNRVGALCAEEGLVFLYHNHDHEFRRFDGEYGLDIMLDNTDPDLVKQELDVAWVTFGGADPVAYLKKHANRCPVLHMKDFEHLHPGSPTATGVRQEAVFAEVGTGVVDTAGVVTAAEEVGVDWLVIEQDRMNTLGPKESLERSVAELKRLAG